MYTPTSSIPDEFAGRRALVTGGSRGIGAAVAQRLIDGGASVVTVSRSRTDDTPKTSTFLAADLRTAEGASSAVEQALQALGGLDILVNNAGAARVHLDGNISDEEWLDSLSINFLSAVRMTTAALPALQQSGHAAIVNISSNATVMAAPPLLHYASAKAALDVYGAGWRQAWPRRSASTRSPRARSKLPAGPPSWKRSRTRWAPPPPRWAPVCRWAGPGSPRHRRGGRLPGFRPRAVDHRGELQSRRRPARIAPGLPRQTAVNKWRGTVVVMVRQSTQARLDALVAAFTELGPAWGHWTSACTPTTSVSYIRMRLLHALECGGDQTMTDLARALGVTQRRVTDLVEALGADQLVERRPNPKDGRSTVVSLTTAGADQLKLSWQQHQTDIGKVFGDLPPEQQKQLLEITPVLTEAIRKRTAARSRLTRNPSQMGGGLRADA